ncbi:hypothetical protein AAGW05_12430 [Arthrobacter sp. LAPM80]|uniref:hypothetical protein n=1 Tax=Arthrobacter sp. LAPM80 TaxID=3141788 RepID=UPI00398ABEC0
MAMWQDAFQEWAGAWAAVQDLESSTEEGAVMIGPRRVMVWPGDTRPRDVLEKGLVLVTEDPDGAANFAHSHGFKATTRQVLMCAETEELDLVPRLPADANLAEAPMEKYDLVEVALFDRPVARGRLRLGEGLAVLAALGVDEGNGELVPVFEQAMVAALGEEAFTHGADVLFLVADEEQAARFTAVEGWGRVAEILNFTK